MKMFIPGLILAVPPLFGISLVAVDGGLCRVVGDTICGYALTKKMRMYIFQVPICYKRSFVEGYNHDYLAHLVENELKLLVTSVDDYLFSCQNFLDEDGVVKPGALEFEAICFAQCYDMGDWKAKCLFGRRA
ncbi:hypothetical protein G3M48_008447 [Beauveria asiatica]|uniref:Uncharacterized protein n=1 Tax=Beauveria asiatica TaxID=1069075 RepID=A0AAW0RKT8_9HYPO